MTIQRLLVANRGEIARRVFATCRRLGIETVAVHADADADLPFVREADVAVRLPGNAPADTYLRVDLLLDAARRTGADAVHPGYGFLSESAELARAVLDAGLTWVGPAPASIEAMGSKIRAKELMRKAGVPVLEAPTEPTASDLPLLVKASAGGGGRGMRVVRDLAALPAEVAAAEAEAASAFGDGTVFVEPYVEHGRHVEVQVVGTAPRRARARRTRLLAPASAPEGGRGDSRSAPAGADPAGAPRRGPQGRRAIDYRGAGTVEFLYDPEQDRFFFLEMNTRLQVEHPVTELVHGVDLVEMQLAVAEGRELERIGETYGHAIEVRLYAEDPGADYQPQSGTLTAFDVPGVNAEFDLLNRPGVRLDSGFVPGNEVSTHYDAMLAKVVAWAPDREQAARRLADTLAKTRIHGVTTNRDQLVATLRDAAFLAGEVSTAFLGERPAAPAPDPGAAAVAAAIALAEQGKRDRTVQRGIPVAWRNVVSQPQVTDFEVSTGSTTGIRVEWYAGRDGYLVDGYDVVAASPDRVTLAERRRQRDVRRGGARRPGRGGRARAATSGCAACPGSWTRPRPPPPARCWRRCPAPWSRCWSPRVTGSSAGTPVLVLEAMKMQHTVSAPASGTVTELDVKAGVQVAAGEVLAVVNEGEES